MIKNIHNKMRQGFTLIELSIVIIIIGILAAGSVVGGKVIENAKFTKFLSDFNELRNGIVTFQTTYAALPGDYDGAYAIARTAAATGGTTDGKVYKGDGNGFIQGGYSGTENTSNDESVSGMNHLTEEGFIDVGFNRLSTGTHTGGGYVSGRFPKSYGDKMLLWHLTSVIPSTSAQTSFELPQNVIAIRDAAIYVDKYKTDFMLDHILGEKIDSKLDDGKPDTGSIQGFRKDYTVYEDGGTDGCNSPTSGTDISYHARCGLRYIIEDL